jgi:hypothetical protein
VRQSQTDTAAQSASELFYSSVMGRSCDQTFDKSYLWTDHVTNVLELGQRRLVNPRGAVSRYQSFGVISGKCSAEFGAVGVSYGGQVKRSRDQVNCKKGSEG